MMKTLLVARREFVATVFTKGFLIGVLMTPVMLAVVIGGVALASRLKSPTVSGRVAVIDRSQGSTVAPLVQERFRPAAMEADNRETAERIAAAGADKASSLRVSPDQAKLISGSASAAALRELSRLRDVTIDILPPTADVEDAKKSLAGFDVRSQVTAANQSPESRGTFALAVIPDASVRAGDDGTYAKFDLYTANRLDPEITEQIERRIAGAIVDARVAADPRFASGGVSAKQLRTILTVPDTNVAVMTASGEKKSAGGLQMLLPMGFMLLLMIAVMTGGQYLLTTTIEEKSSRVMEVLLSAVSPMELMVGKVLGQMLVGLVILIVYSGMGIASLVALAMQHQLDPMLLVYMVIFFFIAFFTMASLMAAVGSAVSELREAQSLMSPIMVLIMLPWVLWLPISRAPNSLFSVVLSFVPGINPFVMMLRLSGSEPPPWWHAPVAIVIGVVTMIVCAWGAAKIFRVGVLMYGKPPNLGTLIRWIRMA